MLSVVLILCNADDVTFEVIVVVSTSTVGLLLGVELFVGIEYVVEVEVTAEVLVGSKTICVVFEVSNVLDKDELVEVTNSVVVVLMTSVKFDLDGAKVSDSLVVTIEPLSVRLVMLVGMMVVVSRDSSLVVTSKVVYLVVSATTVDWC